METKTLNIDEILIRVLNNRGTREDILFFSVWIREEENRVYFEKFKKLWNLSAGKHADPILRQRGLEAYRNFMKASQKSVKREISVWRYVSVAAVLVFVFLSVFWLYQQEEQPMPDFRTETRIKSKGVILTLANGDQVNVLSDTLSVLENIGNCVKAAKGSQREIVYEVIDAGEEADTLLDYNEIIVPAGERFSVVLSDGTRAWINSESSLRYPVRFGKSKRVVEVRGNVYFEVRKDTAHPFVVTSCEMMTEVLGTSFEVNTYGDRNEMSATLVEGSVRVSVGKNSVIMKPDEQVVFNTNNGKMEVFKVDGANRVRWKDGVLVIDNERFDDVIWKLERWYGVSIKNESGMSFNQFFSGEFDREDIHAAIGTICVNLNLHYRIEKDCVFLRK